jgi:hypothetical protein
MRLIDAIDNIFSHNEIIAILEEEDEHHDVLVWHGMAWQLPEEYKNIEKWQIVGVIADKITESDRINININDAVRLVQNAEPLVRCEDCEHYSGGICWHPYITGSCDCDVEKEPDGYCDWGKRKEGESCG